MANTFVLSGIGSDITVKHNSITLDPNNKYEAALLSLKTYNSFSKYN